MLGRRDWSEACIKAAHKIALCAEKTKLPLELNLNGIRYGHKPYKDGSAYVYPYRPFWEIVSQYKTVCVYGYDAHHPTTLLEDDRIQTINEIIDGLPLNIIENYRF
jgi:histidinol-phosphatase (PHP family)